MKAKCAETRSPISSPMTNGTMAPPEMAMHIRPDSSLARSGLLFDGDGKQQRPDIGEAEARGDNARKRQAFDARHQGGGAQHTQQGGKTEARCADSCTVSRRHRPRSAADRQQQENNVPSGHTCWRRSFLHAPKSLLSTGSRNRPMQTSAPT